jgi:hypothetical protein
MAQEGAMYAAAEMLFELQNSYAAVGALVGQG